MKDGMGFQLLRENNIKTGIITSETSQFSDVRANKVNVDFLKISDNANNLKKDYDKQILEASNKVDTLKNHLNLLKINMK